MPEKIERNDAERGANSEGESTEEVTNDSLGTIDASDSTGLGDFNRPKSHQPASERPAKREPGIAPS
jgi:hypothetical protein